MLHKRQATQKLLLCSTSPLAPVGVAHSVTAAAQPGRHSGHRQARTLHSTAGRK